jgi:flagellar hook protein FlgE
MENFSIAWSGLQANSVALNTLAIIWRTLKQRHTKDRQPRSTAGFSSRLESLIGVCDPRWRWDEVSGTSTDFNQGPILSASNINPANMALAGNGFFVVEQDGVQSLDTNRELSTEFLWRSN